MTITMRQARKLLIPVPLIDLNFIVPILLVASLCKSVLRRLLQSFNSSTLQFFNPSILQCCFSHISLLRLYFLLQSYEKPVNYKRKDSFSLHSR
jgi:hypothetical protein